MSCERFRVICPLVLEKGTIQEYYVVTDSNAERVLISCFVVRERSGGVPIFDTDSYLIAKISIWIAQEVSH